MCFSASASFIASGGLAVIGATSLAVARKRDKVLAAVPFLFAIQQGIEGFQWLFINKGSSSPFFGYGFLFFALLVWPIYTPLFVYILDKKQRKNLRWFIGLGALVSLYFFGLLLTQSLLIHKVNACIAYDFHMPFHWFAVGAYIIAIFGSLFVSSRKVFRWFGVITFVLALISWIFFTFAFTSVWCFFAAITSSMFFVYVKRENRR